MSLEKLDVESERDQKSYDEIPYPDITFSHTHPDRLATLGILMGMTPADVQRCRVLELGCATGANIIPMAYGLPDSEFVGVDYSSHQIASASETVATLGLKNMTFKALDIREIDESFGQFDYIIAHGVYSWVPPDVQDAIMAICERNLAPQGIAYVSFSCYPGAYLLRMLRETLLYHVRDVDDPLKRIEGAREVFNVLDDTLPGVEGRDPYGFFITSYHTMLKRERSRFTGNFDAFLLHDELSVINEPCYFYQFMEHADRHGLQYLSETDFSKVMPSDLPEQTVAWLQRVSRDIVDHEQYLDILRNRSFRRTLICHKSVELKRMVNPERIMGLYFGCDLEDGDCALEADGTERFRGADDVVFSTNHPVVKAAIHYLMEISPGYVNFQTLLPEARQQVNADPAAASADARALAASLLQSYTCSFDLIQMRASPPRFVQEVTAQPIASVVARWQSQNANRVTNMRHEQVTMDRLSHFVLQHLDGTRDRLAIKAMIKELVTNGTVEVKFEDATSDDTDEFYDRVVDVAINGMSDLALLVS